MTTTPPTPITKHSEPMLKNWPWTEVELAWIAARDAQWQAYALAARADLEAENQQLRKALGDCLTWMEQLRACGDAGNWHWGEDSEYTRGVAALEKQP